jgi:hypothetical protein
VIDHAVRDYTSVVKRISHPASGELSFDIEIITGPQDPDQRLVVYTCEPDSPTARTLPLLARWFDTTDERGIVPSAGLTARRIGVRLDGERGEEVVEGLVRAFGVTGCVEVHEQAADDGKHDGGQLGPAEAPHAVL